ncbi:membrane protein [Streptomyces hygroscopicus subsp. limoneus]|nr:membrane protein [Streptomyces hygroscopicus subsp. limoneus]
MSLSISLVLLLGIVLVVLIRGGSLKAWPAVVSTLFGFFLASTSMAPEINRLVSSVVTMIGQIRF